MKDGRLDTKRKRKTRNIATYKYTELNGRNRVLTMRIKSRDGEEK